MTELKQNQFLDSHYYNSEMKFSSSFLKEPMKEIGIDNQGSFLIALYAMLVIPKELIKDSEFGGVESFFKKYAINTKSTYDTDKTSIKFLKHIRNAIAHVRVQFSNHSQTVVFRDICKSKKPAEFSMEIELRHVGELLDILQSMRIKYIKSLQRREAVN